MLIFSLVLGLNWILVGVLLLVVPRMCSYNTLCVCDGYPCSCPGPSHGIPACADHELLTTVLRDEWKSKAYVVSDAGAIKFTQTDHEYAAGQPEAAADALAAGADLALGERDRASPQPSGWPPVSLGYSLQPVCSWFGLA